MTRDEIMALEGRELDKAVARRVMGRNVARVTEEEFSVWIPSERDYALSGELYCYKGDEMPQFLPNYSTDIAAAWEVVETDLWFDRYCVARCGSGYGLWRIASNGTLFKFEPEVYADTFPEAICRAALLAVLGEGE